MRTKRRMHPTLTSGFFYAFPLSFAPWRIDRAAACVDIGVDGGSGATKNAGLYIMFIMPGCIIIAPLSGTNCMPCCIGCMYCIAGCIPT